LKIQLPKNVEFIINELNKNGYEAYVVGGCVRDSLLGIMPKDYDITTNTKPEEVKNIFDKTIDTGLQHGTVTVVLDKENYEITTYRIDGIYSDSRRPENVAFTNSLTDDLSRRDITINAMAYNHKDGFIDPFDGQKDLNNMTIRCVGDAYQRLEKEDRLRKMRVIRFAAQLGFDIHTDTFKAIRKYPSLDGISIERIQAEFNKILLSDRTRYGIDLLYQLKLLNQFLPEFSKCMETAQNSPYHVYSVGMHSLIACGNVDIQYSLHLKLAMLLHDIGKPICKTTDENGIDHFYGHAKYSVELTDNILKRMKYDNETINRVKELIMYHDAEIQDNKNSVRKWLNKIGDDSFRNLLKIRVADIYAQNPQHYDERHSKIQRIKNLIEEVIQDKECFTIKDLVIDGNDLIQLGFKQGIEIGNMLNYLLELVIDNPKLNQKDELVKIIKSESGFK
jgi:tRNA nucleotidyltransferase (CCA-adding enzyme)